MSRVGKKPIEVPDGVAVDIKGKVVTAKGPLGEQSMTLLDDIDINIKDNSISIMAKNAEADKKIAAFSGLSRSLLNNMIIGVTKGFEKELEIVGVGYRAIQQEGAVQLQIGFSHHIIFSPPEGVSIEVVEPTKLKVKGIDKQQVGQVAANIRKLRPPEPYKGKGIRYKGEYIRKKAGKAGKVGVGK